jgi:orotate phosphoribosyltransferase
MNALEVLTEHGGVFVNRGCLFGSTTGKLLTGYVNCEVIFPYYQVVSDLVEQLVAPFLDDVDGFVCPQTGDIVLLQHALRIGIENRIPVTGVWADKHGDTNSYHIERNGFEKAIRGRRVLVLNDRISQGGTTLKIVAEARRMHCDVLGVATLCGVSVATAESLSVPKVHALSIVDVEAFWPTEVPEQYREWPIVVDEPLGHGADILQQIDWPAGPISLLS